MNRAFCILFIAALSISCTRNFDPAKDSDLGILTLEVDCWSMLKDIKHYISGESFFSDGDFPEEFRDIAAFRISAYCYNSETGELLNSASQTTHDLDEPVKLRMMQISKTEDSKVIVTGEMVGFDETGNIIEWWYHNRPADLSTFNIRRDTGACGKYSDIIGIWEGTLRAESKPYPVSIKGCGKPVNLTFTNANTIYESWFGYNTTTSFTPSDEKTIREDIYGSMVSADQTRSCFFVYYMSNDMDTFDLIYRTLHTPEAEIIEYSYHLNLRGMNSASISINCSNGEISSFGPWQ